jgi:hypothetical protein
LPEQAGLPGAWDLQRFNSGVWLNNTRFLLTTNGDWNLPRMGAVSDPVWAQSGRVIFNFPDRGYDEQGNTTNWHHYAVTFDAGVVRTYVDGSLYGQDDVSADVT